jgi:hypothetical protein
MLRCSAVSSGVGCRQKGRLSLGALTKWLSIADAGGLIVNEGSRGSSTSDSKPAALTQSRGGKKGHIIGLVLSLLAPRRAVAAAARVGKPGAGYVRGGLCYQLPMLLKGNKSPARGRAA